MDKKSVSLMYMRHIEEDYMANISIPVSISTAGQQSPD